MSDERPEDDEWREARIKATFEAFARFREDKASRADVYLVGCVNPLATSKSGMNLIEADQRAAARGESEPPEWAHNQAKRAADLERVKAWYAERGIHIKGGLLRG